MKVEIVRSNKCFCPSVQWDLSSEYECKTPGSLTLDFANTHRSQVILDAKMQMIKKYCLCNCALFKTVPAV